MPRVEGKINLEHVGSNHVLGFEYRQTASLPAMGTTAPDATNDEKESTLEHITLSRKETLNLCRTVVATKVVTHAAEVLKWKRLDGQPVSNWSNIINYGPDLPHIESYDSMCGGCFMSGWEEIEEVKHMNKLGLCHGAWLDKDKTIKGFCAKLFTQALNSTRKKTTWVKRRTPQEIDADGNKMRRRAKHKIKFDAEKHTHTTPHKKGKKSTKSSLTTHMTEDTKRQGENKNALFYCVF